MTGPDLWVVHLTVDGRSLADLNDDPSAEAAQDAGLRLWPGCLRRVLTALIRVHGGPASQIVYSGRHRTVTRLGNPPEIDAVLLDGLGTYGNVAALWWPADAPAVPVDDVPRARPAWWVCHGYKEQYLIGHSAAVSFAELGALLSLDPGPPVEQSATPFVPHRVTAHGLQR